MLFLTLTRTPLTEPAVESGLRLPLAPPGPATLPRPPKMPQSMVACAIMQLTLSTILVVISKALNLIVTYLLLSSPEHREYYLVTMDNAYCVRLLGLAVAILKQFSQ